jgi:predicted HTH transcriptional regulator
MNPEQFRELIELGKEGRRVEFKQSTLWADLKFKIVKSVLAFSNVRDGGYLIIGITELDGGEFELSGMLQTHLESYTEDVVNSVVSEYADPYAIIRLERRNLDGKTFLLITIEEFHDIPVVCKKDWRL